MVVAGKIFNHPVSYLMIRGKVNISFSTPRSCPNGRCPEIDKHHVHFSEEHEGTPGIITGVSIEEGVDIFFEIILDLEACGNNE